MSQHIKILRIAHFKISIKDLSKGFQVKVVDLVKNQSLKTKTETELEATFAILNLLEELTAKYDHKIMNITCPECENGEHEKHIG